jgi:hypothetical protein
LQDGAAGLVFGQQAGHRAGEFPGGGVDLSADLFRLGGIDTQVAEPAVMVNRGQRILHMPLVKDARLEVGFGRVVGAALGDHLQEFLESIAIAPLANEILATPERRFVHLGGVRIGRTRLASGERRQREQREQAGRQPGKQKTSYENDRHGK